MTYFKPKNMGDVRLLFGGIDDDVPVTLTSGVQLPSTVRTVGDLRRLTAWPTKHRLVVERAPFVEVRVELRRQGGKAAHEAGHAVAMPCRSWLMICRTRRSCPGWPNSFLIRKTVPTPVFRSLAIRRNPRLAAKALLMATTLDASLSSSRRQPD